MVVARRSMLEGLSFEMLVDARGFLKEVAGWAALQRTSGSARIPCWPQLTVQHNQ